MAKGKVNDGLQKQGNAEAESTEKGQVNIAFVGAADNASLDFLSILRENGTDFEVCCVDTAAGMAIMQEHGIKNVPVLKKASGKILDFAAITKTDNNEDAIV